MTMVEWPEADRKGRCLIRLLPAAFLALLVTGSDTAQAQDGFDLRYLMERNRITIANLPTTSDRTDRLKGRIDLLNSAGPFMKALPGVISGTPIPLEASLAAYDKYAGNEQPRLYDVWIKGRAMPLQPSKASPRLATLGVGVDYLVSDELLVGTFAQSDLTSAATLAGWSLGGFGTTRLNQNLYLDVLGARGGVAGQSQASNWLMMTSLTGRWTAGPWTFAPQAKFAHFSAVAPEGVDVDGAIIEAQHRATSELAVGPSVSYKLTTVNKVVVSTGLKLNTVASLVATNGELALEGVRGGLEGTLEIDLPSGTLWKSTIGYSGIGQGQSAFNLKGSLGVPLR